MGEKEDSPAFEVFPGPLHSKILRRLHCHQHGLALLKALPLVDTRTLSLPQPLPPLPVCGGLRGQPCRKYQALVNTADQE